MKALIVTGTDTNVGKTVVAAMLTLALDGYYWKPIQSGIDGGTDAARVSKLTGLAPSRILPERFILKEPLSPHRAAELDQVVVDKAALELPRVPKGSWLIVEGAGGILVPIDRSTLEVELFAQWGLPIIVVARTNLGTINHTLLTLEALKRRNLAVLGIVFSGAAMPDTERTIAEFGGVANLGRLPLLASLDRQRLRDVFAAHFNRDDFEGAYAR